jgi:threonine/homoserine/homoserine lactone efflux protein
MLGTHDLALFVVSGLLLNVTPGADTLYIVGRSTTEGARAGAVAALGIGAGCIVHALAAALGLSALLAASATAFTVAKLAGAAYLVWLGATLLLARPAPAARTGSDGGAAPPTPLSTVFWQGLLTNVLNPKVALFFLAFLPQFVVPRASGNVAAFLFLGLVFNVNGTLWNLFVAWATATLRQRLRIAGSWATWLRRLAGSAFVALGIELALAERR